MAAVVQVQFLAQELPHATRVVKKKKKKVPASWKYYENEMRQCEIVHIVNVL